MQTKNKNSRRKDGGRGSGKARRLYSSPEGVILTIQPTTSVRSHELPAAILDSGQHPFSVWLSFWVFLTSTVASPFSSFCIRNSLKHLFRLWFMSVPLPVVELDWRLDIKEPTMQDNVSGVCDEQCPNADKWFEILETLLESQLHQLVFNS